MMVNAQSSVLKRTSSAKVIKHSMLPAEHTVSNMMEHSGTLWKCWNNTVEHVVGRILKNIVATETEHRWTLRKCRQNTVGQRIQNAEEHCGNVVRWNTVDSGTV